MAIVFYISAIVTLLASVMVITRANAVHALLYLIVTLLGVAMAFFSLGAPFVAAIEVIVYAGAIMVLFVFVVMMLNLDAESGENEPLGLRPRDWVGPAMLNGILALELIVVVVKRSFGSAALEEVGPEKVGMALFGPYLLGVELASFLLLAGLVGAYHLGRRQPPEAGKDVD